MTALLVLLIAWIIVSEVWGVVRQFLWEREREAWARERAELLQRIQAPEVAVQQHVADRSEPDLPHVPFDDDEAFFEAKKRGEA